MDDWWYGTDGGVKGEHCYDQPGDVTLELVLEGGRLVAAVGEPGGEVQYNTLSNAAAVAAYGVTINVYGNASGEIAQIRSGVRVRVGPYGMFGPGDAQKWACPYCRVTQEGDGSYAYSLDPERAAPVITGLGTRVNERTGREELVFDVANLVPKDLRYRLLWGPTPTELGTKGMAEAFTVTSETETWTLEKGNGGAEFFGVLCTDDPGDPLQKNERRVQN